MQFRRRIRNSLAPWGAVRFLWAAVLVAGYCTAAGFARGSPPRIEWDQSTKNLVQAGAGYARMIRLKSDRILCTYDRGGIVRVKASADNGRTWRSETVVAGCSFGHATNPEIVQLDTGRILVCYNERPTDKKHPFAILVSHSDDGGKTWSAPRRLYEAGSRWENGCWEPAAVQLPSGEVQMFFANEGPYRQSTEQEISMLVSRDAGNNWSRARKIGFRAGHRDGMPVPLVLRGARGIVVAIEDNGLQGRFKPAILYSPVRRPWRSTVKAVSPYRWAALRHQLAADVYAGAPYIRQMPSGETILSVQSKEGGRKQPLMVVYIGNTNARNFDHKSVPIQVPSGTACLWNSLFVKDAKTITAVVGTTIDGQGGVWAIDGRFFPGDAVKSRSRLASPRPFRLPRPNRADENPLVVATWHHVVAGGKPVKHVFYSNGKINDSRGGDQWTVRGNSLTLRWPNQNAPNGAWVDRCRLSKDGRTYTGKNQNGTRIEGKLVAAGNRAR